jgi:hypothetical protein
VRNKDPENSDKDKDEDEKLSKYCDCPWCKNKNYENIIIQYDASSDSALGTAIGYGTKSNMYSTAIGQNSQANGTYSIGIGRNAQATNSYGVTIGINCINTNSQYIKFWIGTSSVSALTGVQFGNIIFGINNNDLTINNATSFDIRPTLASVLSAPTNNNDVVTKEYVDSLIPDLTNYLTADIVYIPPETLPIDISGITGHNPDDYKLVTKNMWMIYLIR